MKITLALPVYGGLEPNTLQCLLELIAHGVKNIDTKTGKSIYDFHIVVAENGYTIAENRNYITIQALNNKSDYLLMIDADMTFPPTLLDDLLRNNKEICGVAYHPRSETGQIIKFLDETHAVRLEDPEIKKDPKYQDVFECHATGTGIILIKCEVFKKIPQPWFMFEYYPTGQCKLGEDWFFSREAKKAGFKIWCDPRIQVGHIGEVVV